MTLAAITSLQRALGEWAEKPAVERFLRADQEAVLGAAIGDPQRRTQVHVAAWMLGTWHLGHGFWRVLRGDGRGFDEARSGQELRRCALLLRASWQPAQRRGARRLPFSLAHGTQTALLGLALHDPGAEPLFDLLRAQPDGAFGADDWLALFTRELLALRAGERPVVTPRLGPAQDVLMQWRGDGRLLAQALAHLLDVRLEKLRAGGDDPGGQLYPFEVFAVQNVREWLELDHPKVEHPLMSTNLATMKATGPWPATPLAQRLAAESRAN